ncbi:MAG TPA: hypothetical protein VHA33_17415 [Candidatus Angelobacter sp.]|jgi:hypothetical protein|nr:hypothetical protein [Candidatus Angelobacter sp.]
MLDKSGYYHGAAIIRVLEDSRCRSVRKDGVGYVINEEVAVFLKYSTKARSPWGFTFDGEDINRCHRMEQKHERLILGLVCGGDGVCALEWREADKLLANKPGRIAAGRKHNESYAVWGTAGTLKGKIPVGRWPTLSFQGDNTLIVLQKQVNHD